MNRDVLFVRTVEDLHRRVTTPRRDEYEAMTIAALLRKLLIDSEPLIDQVNRSRRVKIRFRTSLRASMAVADLPEPEIPGDGPPGFFGGSKTCTKDQYLARFATWIAPHEYTVKDLILYVANVKGAVHAGSPRDARQQSLQDVGHRWPILGIDPSVYALYGIGATVVQGLVPLYRLVKEDLAPRARHGRTAPTPR